MFACSPFCNVTFVPMGMTDASTSRVKVTGSELPCINKKDTGLQCALNRAKINRAEQWFPTPGGAVTPLCVSAANHSGPRGTSEPLFLNKETLLQFSKEFLISFRIRHAGRGDRTGRRPPPVRGNCDHFLKAHPDLHPVSHWTYVDGRVNFAEA